MKLVFNSLNQLIAYGSDEGYEPFIANGNRLEIMTNEEAQPYIAQFSASIVPLVVSMRQARLALLQSNLLTQVTTAINASTDADKITWETATEVRRSDALVSNMATALNLNGAQLDSLFTLADSL